MVRTHVAVFIDKTKIAYIRRVSTVFRLVQIGDSAILKRVRYKANILFSPLLLYSRGVTPTWCTKVRENDGTELYPAARAISLIFISVCKSCDFAAAILELIRYCCGERPYFSIKMR